MAFPKHFQRVTRQADERGFLTRLARDTAGTTMAMMAVALIPLIGLVGGGVDASRIYIVQTRMQQACDSGALAGRKAMGSGNWTTTAGGTRDQAQEMFSANFMDGDFGATLVTVGGTFSESDGTVSGTANANVPMTLLKAFGQPTKNVAVTCTAKMEIPNTDVMFVLDLTASMNCAPGSSATCYNTTPQTNAKITGLKKAVKCFYEALLKVNTAEPCTAVVSGGTTSYNSTGDPSGSSYGGTAQIRLGFVPYGVNVNVGKLLPHTYVADDVLYQSREAITVANTWSYTLGTETATGWGGWSSAPSQSTLENQSGYSGWTTISGGGSVTVNGQSRPKTVSLSAGVTNCNTQNLVGTSPNKMLAYTVSPGSISSNLTGTTNNPPTRSGTPPTEQTLSYDGSQPHTVTGYKYIYDSSTNPDVCRLQSGTRSYTLTRSGTSTKSITWTEHPVRFNNWEYKQRTLDVSGLKSGTDAWNSSVLLPLGSTYQDVYLSGTSSTTRIYERADVSVAWDGCIEEAPTFQNTDGNLSDDWSGTMPTGALDMNIDLMPDTETNRWKPLLPDTFWGRYTGSDANRSTTKTLSTVTKAASGSQLLRNMDESVIGGYYCPTAARKLGTYNTSANFESYISSLSATSMGTYHDIGMLWGARLLSPTGIFGDENDYTDNGGAIERHLIFMTDGDASTFTNNLSAYGSPWWDRRQMNTAPTTAKLDNAVEARLARLCEDIKAKNIELWVISYGGAVDSANETRLENCASPNRYYSAADTPALISNFRQIASEIADLRLTT